MRHTDGLTERTEADLVAFFRERFEDADPTEKDFESLFEMLWGAFSEDVFLSAFSIVSDHERASDLCSDAFVRALEALRDPARQPVEQVNFRAWLKKIAKNLAFMSLRHDQVVGKTRPRVRNELEWLQQAPPPDRMLDVDSRVDVVEQCLDRLTQKRREVIVMADVEEYTHEEIASRLHISRGAVRARLHQARGWMRACIEMEMIQ